MIRTQGRPRTSRPSPISKRSVSKHDPEQPHGEKLGFGLCCNPPDEQVGHGEDQERPDQDADFPGREVADDWYEQDAPQNAVNHFSSDDDEPHEEGTDQDH